MSLRYYVAIVAAGALIGHTMAYLAESGHTPEALSVFLGTLLAIYATRIAMEEV